MRVFDGTTQVARFGTTAIIGEDTKKHIKITPTEVTIGDSAEQYFTVNMEGKPNGADPQYYYSTITFTDKTGHSMTSVATLTGAPTWEQGSRITLWQTITESGTDIPNTLTDTLRADFIFGTAGEVSVPSDVLGVTYIYIYDGYDRVSTIGMVLSNSSKRSSKYLGYVTIKTPSLEFGESNNEGFVPGADSACLGIGLVALGYGQAVIGKWNEYDDTSDYTRSKYSFIIGNGGSDTTRGNALTVDWAGNINCNDITASGDITATGEVTGSNIFKLAHGKIDDNDAPANGYQSIGPIYYSSAGFTSPPNVIIGFESSSTASGFGKCSCSVYNVTATYFYARIFNADTSSRSPNLNWIAIGT